MKLGQGVHIGVTMNPKLTADDIENQGTNLSEVLTAAWRIHNRNCDNCRAFIESTGPHVCPVGTRIREASRIVAGLPAED